MNPRTHFGSELAHLNVYQPDVSNDEPTNMSQRENRVEALVEASCRLKRFAAACSTFGRCLQMIGKDVLLPSRREVANVGEQIKQSEEEVPFVASS